MTFRSDLIKKVGKNIRFIREEKGITQTDLSNVVKINKNYISDLERGQRNASIETLERVANGLDVKVVDFFKL